MIKTLKTQAKDNHGYSYKVVLRFEEKQIGQTIDLATGKWHNAPCHKWVLSIENTPGKWYMSTLLESDKYSSGISLDFGQNWNCDNFQEVLNEAKELI
jgi:hypothetical protein